MRGFMRAIGLGGLFKHHASSATSTASQSAKRRAGRGSRGAAMGALVPTDEIQLTMPDQRMSRARSRDSSVSERPQFLFFCGSDNSGVAASRRTGYQPVAGTTDFSFSKAEVQARATIKSPKIETPMISHRMPVFFAPQHVMLPHFE